MCRTITRYHLSPTGKPRLNHAVTALPSFLVKPSGHHGARQKKAPHVAMRCFYKLIWLA